MPKEPPKPKLTAGKRRKPFADAPPGVGLGKVRNGHGTVFWRLRLGKKFTNGKVVRKDFPTKSAAVDWFFGPDATPAASSPSPVELRKHSGSSAFDIAPGKLAAALEAQRELEKANINTGLVDVVRFYIRHTRPVGGAVTIEAAIKDLIEAKKKAGRSGNYTKGLNWSLLRLAEDFSGSPMHEISRDDFERWLDEEEFSLATRRNYIRDCSILFNHAVKRKWMVESPSQNIEKPNILDQEIEILNVDQIEKLLRTARDFDCHKPFLCPVAIQLFAGLRVSEVTSLNWEQVGEREITVLASSAKTRKRRNCAVTETLESWIGNERKFSGPISFRGSAWRKGFTNLMDAAEIIPWPRNALRHSFGTYHLAEHKNENLTAAEMGNTPQVIYAHYRKLIPKGESAKFWALRNELAPALTSSGRMKKKESNGSK